MPGKHRILNKFESSEQKKVAIYDSNKKSKLKKSVEITTNKQLQKLFKGEKK